MAVGHEGFNQGINCAVVYLMTINKLLKYLILYIYTQSVSIGF